LKKNIYISPLEMASAENRHCANCIGTVSFPIRHRSGAKRQCALNPATADLLRGTHCDEYLILHATPGNSQIGPLPIPPQVKTAPEMFLVSISLGIQ